MRISLADVSREEVIRNWVEGWIYRFPEAHRKMEFTLWSSLELIGAIFQEWKRVLTDSDLVHARRSDEYPRLIHLIGQLPPNADSSSTSSLLDQIGLAWESGIRICSDSSIQVHVAGQTFDISGEPFLSDKEKYLASLSDAVQRFRNISTIGNLGHPPADREEQVFRLVGLDNDDRIPMEERYFWESRLSDNQVKMRFKAESEFDFDSDFPEEVSHISSLLGRSCDTGGPPKYGFAEWVRRVQALNEIVGKEVLTLLHNREDRCLHLSLYSHNKKFLSPFALTCQVEDIDWDSKQFSWPLPNQPCYSRMLSASISFTSK
jgi:hypothetical protein